MSFITFSVHYLFLFPQPQIQVSPQPIHSSQTTPTPTARMTHSRITSLLPTASPLARLKTMPALHHYRTLPIVDTHEYDLK